MVHTSHLGGAGACDLGEVAEGLADAALVLLFRHVLFRERLLGYDAVIPRLSTKSQFLFDELPQTCFEPGRQRHFVNRVNLPHGRLDCVRVLRDGHQELVMREDGLLGVASVVLHAVRAVGQPVRQGKVDRLVEVELTSVFSQ